MEAKLDWREAKKACRILILHPCDIKKDTSNWNEYFAWMCDMAIKLREITYKFGSS